MTGPFLSANDAGHSASGKWLADRLVRRAAGSPGLVDVVAIQGEVARKLGWLGRSFPVLQRLLARAAGGDGDGFVGSAPPLAIPFAALLGDAVTPLRFAQMADHAPLPSASPV